MNNFIQKSIKRVAIIGGGAGGIAAARALRNEATFQTITIFERNEHNGGTW
jgi:cation diffusion facilitator CzcD-associated flavoprotein CzcO